MNPVMKWAKEHIKSLVAAIVGAAITVIMKWVNGEVPWPQTGAEWRDAAIGAVVAGVMVSISPTNKITQKQLDKDPDVVGGVVISDAPNQPKSLPYPENPF